MAEAHILKNGIIVQAEGWTKLRHSITTGFLASFTKLDTGVEYIHINKGKFRKKDQKIFSAGYYPKIGFLKYLATRDIQHINFKTKYSAAYGFINAVTGDTLHIRILDVNMEEANPLAFSRTSDFTYNSSKNYIAYYRIEYEGTEATYNTGIIKGIIIPDTGVTETIESLNLDTTAANFMLLYSALINGSQNINVDDKKTALITVAKTSLVITLIIKDIFTLFPDQTIFNDFIQAQKNYWYNEDTSITNIFDTYSPLNDYKDYFGSIYDFYISIYKNSIVIKNAPFNKKLFYLGTAMSSEALSTLSLDNKLKILEALLDSKTEALSTITNKKIGENLVIRILNSFSFEIENNNFTNLNLFLEWLITKKKETGALSSANYKTYYELFYDRMSSSFNITKTLITFENWVFNTDFKATDTRDAYVQSLYALWQYSKYNPYDTFNSLKPNVIGFKSIDINTPVNERAVSYTEQVGDYLFTYSHLSGLETYLSSENSACANWPDYCTSKYFYRKAYYANNAAPIVVPYESEKSFGMYFDNFNLDIFNDTIKTKRKVPVGYKAPVDENQDGIPDDNYDFGRTKYDYLLFGTYKIYQPVTLLNANLETKVPIITTTGKKEEIDGTKINSFIPAFVLHHVGKSGDRNNTEKLIGYTVEGALTLSGIGNLSKLSHLRWFGGEFGLWSLNGFRVILGGIEFTASVLSFLGNFIDCDQSDETCKNIKLMLTIIEIGSGAVDGITRIALKKQSRKIVESTGGGVTREERIIEVKNKLQQLDNSGASPQVIEDSATKIVDLAKFGNRAEEFADLIRLLDDFPSLKSQLNLYLSTNPEIAHAIVASLKKDRDVFKILDDNPSFLDNLDDVNDVKSTTKTINLLSKSKSRLLQRIQKFESVRFNNIHSDDELKGIAERAIELNLPTKELDDFLYISCRTGPPPPDKRIIANELKDQISYWQNTIKVNGFPSRFNSLDDFIIFSERLKTLMRSYNLPTNNIFIQGSSLRKINPDDIDVAVFLTKEELNMFLLYQEDVWKTRKIKGVNVLSKTNSKFKKYKKSVSQTKNSIIKPGWWKNVDGISINEKAGFPDTFDDVSHLFEGVSDYSSDKLNLSIIITDGKYDVSPYLKIN